jgi:transketolase
MDSNSLGFLKKLVNDYRAELFEKFVEVGQGHPGSTFSMLDIVTTLYHGGYMDYRKDSNRFANKLLISKGHATVALYPILKHFEIIPKEDWDNWGKGLPSRLRVFGNTSIPGIDMTSGSLGHGVGVGAGMAIANPHQEIYTVISEGELYEGSTWEALLFVAHRQIRNMTIFIDINNLIILGKTDDCLMLNSIREKLSGFPFDLYSVDGHNPESIMAALDAGAYQPKIILCNTVKGKGFSLMENKPEWHYMQPITPEQIEQCRKEINNATA